MQLAIYIFSLLISPHIYFNSIPKREYDYFFLSSAASRFSSSFCFFNISTFPPRTSFNMKNSATSAVVPAPTKKEDIRENNPMLPPLVTAVIVNLLRIIFPRHVDKMEDEQTSNSNSSANIILCVSSAIDSLVLLACLGCINIKLGRISELSSASADDSRYASRLVVYIAVGGW